MSAKKVIPSNATLQTLAHKVAAEINDTFTKFRSRGFKPRLFAIPRGGIPAAYLIASYCSFTLIDNPAEAEGFIDDLVDSGNTRDKYEKLFPGKPFFALLDKKRDDINDWIVFPWENDAANRSEDDTIVGTITNRFRENGVSFFANDNIAEQLLPGEMEQVEAEVGRRAQSLLEGLLIDVKADHNTQGTAERMAKMFCREIFAGRYTSRPKITEFPNAKQLDEMYVTGPITLRSACSHHFCPIVGRVWVGIVPGEKVVGLSKFNRLVEWVASRPQIQEELVVQIANELEKLCAPKGLAVVIKATHFCMTWRGVQENAEAEMTTSVVRGVIRDKPEARAEFFALIK